MMNYRFFLVSIILCNGYSVCAQQNNIIIEIHSGDKFKRKDTLHLFTQEINLIDLNNRVDTNNIIIEKGKTAKILITTAFPQDLFSKDIFGTGDYLAEPGDRIHVFVDSGYLHFSGIGAEKFRLIYECSRLESTLSIENNIDECNSMEDYFKVQSYVTKRLDGIDSLIEIYKPALTSFAYRYIKTKLFASIEREKIVKFYALYGKMSSTGIASEHFRDVFDSTIASSPVLKLIDSAGESSNFLKYFIFEFTRVKYARNHNFEKPSSLGYKEQIIGNYRLARADYKGIVREKLLAYLIRNWIIRKLGFTPEVEWVLNDYYNLPGNREYKEWVRDYELKARQLKGNQIAPGFTLETSTGRNISLADLKGKLVVLDFWFTGCAGCTQMTAALKKVEASFKENQSVVFLNISTDRNKDKWLESVRTRRYTTGNGINAYTEGEGQRHPIVKHYNVQSYPSLYLIDQEGRIVVNPVPDPRADSGSKLIRLIRKKVTEAADGPYVIYRMDQAIAKCLTFTDSGDIKVDSIILSNNGNDTVDVSTDEWKRKFSVGLKRALLTEPSTFPKVSKLLVLSDIEGNFEAFRKLLQSQKVIDTAFNWIFDTGHLVLNGDFFDRGEQVTECLWLIYALEEKAKAAGGYVHFILGNHELMNLNGELNYVHEKYKNGARQLKEEYRVLYGVNSELGRWLRTKNIMERIGDILFMHGGASQQFNNLDLSIEEINKLARKYYDNSDMARSKNGTAEQVLFNYHTSPFWFRGYYENNKENRYPIAHINSTLNKFGVSRIVTGHTIVADTVSVHYGGKVINVDTHHAEGKSEALFIENDNYYAVNIIGKKELLFSFEGGLTKRDFR